MYQLPPDPRKNPKTEEARADINNTITFILDSPNLSIASRNILATSEIQEGRSIAGIVYMLRRTDPDLSMRFNYSFCSNIVLLDQSGKPLIDSIEAQSELDESNLEYVKGIFFTEERCLSMIEVIKNSNLKNDLFAKGFDVRQIYHAYCAQQQQGYRRFIPDSEIRIVGQFKGMSCMLLVNLGLSDFQSAVHWNQELFHDTKTMGLRVNRNLFSEETAISGGYYQMFGRDRVIDISFVQIPEITNHNLPTMFPLPTTKLYANIMQEIIEIATNCVVHAVESTNPKTTYLSDSIPEVKVVLPSDISIISRGYFSEYQGESQTLQWLNTVCRR